MDKIIAIVHDPSGGTLDVEIPLDITARELIAGLHRALRRSGECPRSMRAENPIAFLTGERTLERYGLHDGTDLYFYEG